jgi:hypothetical protein
LAAGRGREGFAFKRRACSLTEGLKPPRPGSLPLGGIINCSSLAFSFAEQTAPLGSFLRTKFAERGTDLAQFFAPVERKIQGLDANVAAVSAKLVAQMGLPKNLSESHVSSMQFCNLTSLAYETDKKLPARQKLWHWVVKALRGLKPVPGPYHYLVDEVQCYDISYLFKRLCQVLEQITICSLDDELEAVIKLDFLPAKQNIFSYFADLRRAVKKLHDINEKLPQKARIVLPDAYLRSRLVRAARQVGVFM